MTPLLVYSSQSGNTRKVADAVGAVLPAGALVAPVKEAPEPDDFAPVIIGFWVHRAQPDPLTCRYLEKIKGKQVAAFGTLVAAPDSAHAGKVVENLAARLADNDFLGCFLCQGALAPQRLEARLNNPAPNPTHPLTPERKALLLSARSHPDAADLKAAQKAMLNFLAAVKNL